MSALYSEKNKLILDHYSLSKADPELIKQVFKQQQSASEDNRIFSLEIFLKRGTYIRDLENLISSFSNEVYRSKTGNRYHFNSTLNIEKLKMLCDCNCVVKKKAVTIVGLLSEKTLLKPYWILRRLYLQSFVL
jgi:hypothetical protein